MVQSVYHRKLEKHVDGTVGVPCSGLEVQQMYHQTRIKQEELAMIQNAYWDKENAKHQDGGLWDTEKRTADSLEHISGTLDAHFAPAEQPQPPRVASDFASTMKSVIQAADDAESVRQHDIDAAVRYQGSQAYEDAVQQADARYTSNFGRVGSSAKAALKGIVGEMMSEYQKNTMYPLLT